jgi:hypothetical protein
MNFKQRMIVVTITGALGCAGNAFAELSKAEMKTEKNRIAAEYKSAKAKCDGLKGNAKDVCMAEAKGTNKIAKAELEARDKGTPKAQADVRTARAEADYNVAKEKCDDLNGNAKDVCKKDAKAAFTAAKEAAKVEKTAGRSNEKVAEARQDAREETRDANYAAAKERCDSLSGDAKDRCVADAKARFNVR